MGPGALVRQDAQAALPDLQRLSEELSAKASYKQPWARGQRCIIPAAAFYEPCWESGRHVPWRFTRADGQPWGLAGLWNTWVDRDSGEVVESYTMLTLNADAHPLMRRMHKPDPKLGPDEQDKRSVVPLRPADWDIWLHAPQAEVAALIRLAPAEDFLATPEAPPAALAADRPTAAQRARPVGQAPKPPTPIGDLFDEPTG